MMKKIKFLVAKLFSKSQKSRGQDNENDNFNIKDQDYNDLNLMLKFGKSSNRIGKYESKPFIELPYGLIKKDLPAYQKQELIGESIELIMQNQFPDFEIKKTSGNDVIGFLLWIKEQQEFIKNIEEANLQSDPEPEMLAAGIHKLNEFGIAPMMEKIAKDWNYTPEQVEQTEYFKIYEKMKLDKVQGEINKNYQKIIEEKSKRKR